MKVIINGRFLIHRVTGVERYAREILAELDKIIEDNDINVVLPFIDPAIEVAARCKTRHADVFVPVSDAVVAHDMFDKVLAARLF